MFLGYIGLGEASYRLWSPTRIGPVLKVILLAAASLSSDGNGGAGKPAENQQILTEPVAKPRLV
jgi:hypothetical protein